MTTFNLTCAAVEATLPDYLDETLEPWVRTSIEEHLAGCTRCTGLARELRNITQEASALPALLPEEDAWPRIAGRIGAPVPKSETLADSAPLTPPPEDTLPATYASIPVSEPRVAPGEVTIESDRRVLEREVPLPTSESFAEPSAPAPMIAGEVPPLEREVGLSIHESFTEENAARALVDTEVPLDREVQLLTSEPFLEVSEPAPVLANELPPVHREVLVPTSELVSQISEPSLVINEPSVVTDQPTSLEREVPVPPSEVTIPVKAPVPLPDAAALPGTATVYTVPVRRTQTWRSRRIGLAAAALVLVTAASTFLLTVQWLGPAPPNVASDTQTAKPAATENGRTVTRNPARASTNELSAPEPLTPTTSAARPGSALAVSARPAALVARSAEEAVYDREIVGLQKIVQQQRRGLDTSTVAEIDKNLRSIDSAIGQIRSALQRDPRNSMLDDQSSHALEMKVELLRRAAMLRSST